MIDFFIVEYWYPASRSGGEKNYTVAKVFDCHEQEQHWIDFGPNSLDAVLKWAQANCNTAYIEYRVRITKREYRRLRRLAEKGVIDNEF